MRLTLKNRYIIISSNGFKIFVLTDLHLGLEQEKAHRSIQFAQISQKVIEKLFSDVEREKPTHLFILGDIKQSIGYKTTKEEVLLRTLYTFLAEHEIQCMIAQGNHDADINTDAYSNISISSPQGFVFPMLENKNIGFAHGHAYPSNAYNSHTFLLILGHLHPVVQLSEDHVNAIYYLPIFLRTDSKPKSFHSISKLYSKAEIPKYSILQEILVLPAYNEFLGGYSVNFPENTARKGFCSQLLWMFDFQLILLDGTVLGNSSNLSPQALKHVSDE